MYINHDQRLKNTSQVDCPNPFPNTSLQCLATLHNTYHDSLRKEWDPCSKQPRSIFQKEVISGYKHITSVHILVKGKQVPKSKSAGQIRLMSGQRMSKENHRKSEHMLKNFKTRWISHAHDSQCTPGGLANKFFMSQNLKAAKISWKWAYQLSLWFLLRQKKLSHALSLNTPVARIHLGPPPNASDPSERSRIAIFRKTLAA